MKNNIISSLDSVYADELKSFVNLFWDFKDYPPVEGDEKYYYYYEEEEKEKEKKWACKFVVPVKLWCHL